MSGAVDPGAESSGSVDPEADSSGAVERGGDPSRVELLLTEQGVACSNGPGGQPVGFPSRETYHALAAALLLNGFSTCSDLCAVDYLTHPVRMLTGGVATERFEIVVNLLDMNDPCRVRLRVQVPDEDARIDSLFDIYPGVEAMEREAFDMFGIDFAGHPDLTRILMPEDWEGHPLRKDYDIGAVPVRFKEAGVRRGEEVHTARDRGVRLDAAAAAASSGSSIRLGRGIPFGKKNPK